MKRAPTITLALCLMLFLPLLSNYSFGNPLIDASKAGNASFIKKVIDAGADVNSKDNNGWTLLHWAVRESHAEVVQVLANAGADVSSKDNDGLTPLHWAARFGYTDVVRILIDAESDVNSKDDDGLTPLHRAEDINIIEILIDAGAKY